MVSTVSAAAQATEMDKRRKQILEKARANHLSRQLQMRLQYARLKVEHGWQQQNLNEVENLYFHHSHQRGPKPPPPSSTLLAVTHADSPSSSEPSKLSDPSYRAWLHSLSRYSTSDVLDSNVDHEQGSNISNSASVFPASTSTQAQPALQGMPISTTTPIALAEANSAQVSQSTLIRTPTRTFQTLPLQNGNSAIDASGPSNILTLTPTTSFNIASRPTFSLQSPMSPPSVNANLNDTNTSASTVTTPVAAAKAKKASGRTQSSHKNATQLTPKDMFNFNSSSLTYDSFWSGLQSKSYPALKSATATTSGTETGITGPGADVGETMPSPLLTNTQSSSSPTSSITTPVLQSDPTPTRTPSHITNANSVTQNRSFSGGTSPWNFGPVQADGAAHFLRTSLLTNPSALPFLTNLSAFTNSFNVGETQAQAPGVVGVNTTGVGSTTSSASPPPMPTSSVATALVGQQES